MKNEFMSSEDNTDGDGVKRTTPLFYTLYPGVSNVFH